MPIASVSFQGPIALPGYYMVPNGGKVLYVHSSGSSLSELPAGLNENMYTSLNSAMAGCRSNRGDAIIVLPGHTESVATATALSSLVAGVTVLGVGNADERPTFTWTAAAAQWALNKANVRFQNCIFNLAGTAATTVTKAMAVTALTKFFGCKFILAAAGGSQRAAIGVEFGAGSDKSAVEECEISGAADGAFTDGFLIAAAIDRFRFRRNYGDAGPAGANGIVRFSAAATNIIVDENVIENTLAGANSTAVFVGVASLTGQFAYNSLSVQNNGTASAQGIITLGNARANQNFASDEAAKSGLLTPVAAT